MKTKIKTKPTAKIKAVVKRNSDGLTMEEASQALSISKAAPEQTRAIVQYRDAVSAAAGYYWNMVDALRKPVILCDDKGNTLPPQRMNAREIRLLLSAHGMVKSRISEVNTAVEMDDAQYALIRQHRLSKDDALKVARGTAVLEIEDGEATVKTAAKGDAKAKPAEAKSHRATKTFIEAVHNALDVDTGMKAVTDNLPYEFKGKLADGREYEVRVFIDQAPTK